MPLIILSGIPCSGKSKRALQLQDYFAGQGSPGIDNGKPTTTNGNASTERRCPSGWPTAVQIVNDHSLRVTHADYDDPALEKNARASMLSAVERALNKDTLVIADGMNYIKGFRYQLYCIARALGTPHCVVHCGVPVQEAREWNASRRLSTYSEQTFNELVARFEEPDGRNRWDAPLFVVMHHDETPPMDAIVDALIHRKAPPPNMSTVVKPLSDANYLYQLEKDTSDLISALFRAQSDHPPGTLVSLRADVDSRVRLPGFKISLPELKTLRRQFLSLNNQRTLTDVRQLNGLFVRFLSEQLNL